jgi:hypothetical protein
MPRVNDDDYELLIPDFTRDPEKGSTRTTQAGGSLYRLCLVVAKWWVFLKNVDAARRESIKNKPLQTSASPINKS